MTLTATQNSKNTLKHSTQCHFCEKKLFSETHDENKEIVSFDIKNVFYNCINCGYTLCILNAENSTINLSNNYMIKAMPKNLICYNFKYDKINVIWYLDSYHIDIFYMGKRTTQHYSESPPTLKNGKSLAKKINNILLLK